MLDRQQARQWLGIIFADAPGYLHICSYGDWRGRTFPNTGDGISAAVDYATDLDAQGRQGIYWRATTLGKPLEEIGDGASRGRSEDTAAYVGFWADVDIAGPGHADPPPGAGALPADTGAGYALIANTGLPVPSLWVHSGGGLYPLWLLDVPYIIGGDTDLAIVAETSALWQQIIAHTATERGLHYGAGIGDPARVLRLPGSTNRKAGLERPCRIETCPDRPMRYTFDELQEIAATLGSRIQAPPPPELPASRPERAAGDITPGDDYAARTDWADILELHGWTLHSTIGGGRRRWRRPGKTSGNYCASTNMLGTDRLYVYCTNTYPFEARSSYGKLGALAVLEHSGDLSEAARALYARGYGTRVQGSDQRRDWQEGAGQILGKAVPDSNHTKLLASRPVEDVQLPPPPPVESSTGPDYPPPPPGPTGPTGPNPAGPGRTPAEDDPELAGSDLLDGVRYRQEVAYETHRLRVRRDAKDRLTAEDWETNFREPPSTLTLAQELELPDEPVRFRVDQVMPAGSNVLFAAQYKIGKSTTGINFVRSLVDAEPFLGRFDIDPPAGRVAIFNYEVSASQYRRWLRSQGIVNADRVCILNIRGYRLPPTISQVEAWLVKWLREREVTVWVVDPFARAFVGCGEENSNTDVGLFLDVLDSIKEQAGVGELLLPVHTGRIEQEIGQERARGATRLDDWADARWLLTADDQGRRYFRATGRDVEVPEELLTFDTLTGRLTMGGWDRTGMRQQDSVDQVVGYVADNPGLSVAEIVEGVGKKRSSVTAALHEARTGGRVWVDRQAHGKCLHYVVGTGSNG